MEIIEQSIDFGKWKIELLLIKKNTRTSQQFQPQLIFRHANASKKAYKTNINKIRHFSKQEKNDSIIYQLLNDQNL
jgi:hypothetical protein